MAKKAETYEAMAERLQGIADKLQTATFRWKR